MSEKLADKIIVTHTLGGMIEFERTGIYPNKLNIKSSKFNHIWRVQIREESQSGMLKINRLPVYFYGFDETEFKIQELLDGEIKPDFLDFELKSRMSD